MKIKSFVKYLSVFIATLFSGSVVIGIFSFYPFDLNKNFTNKNRDFISENNGLNNAPTDIVKTNKDLSKDKTSLQNIIVDLTFENNGLKNTLTNIIKTNKDLSKDKTSLQKVIQGLEQKIAFSQKHEGILKDIITTKLKTHDEAIISFLKSELNAPFDEWMQISDREVNCLNFKNSDTAIILTFGQSNAANHGETKFKPEKGVYNFYFNNGRCYVAEDPLLGASGKFGSVWTRLGDLLIKNNVYKQVLLVPIAQGGAPVEGWVPHNGANLYPRIEIAFNRLTKLGLTLTHLLWHQGESDKDSTGIKYEKSFLKMYRAIRNLGVTAPLYIALATYCDGYDNDDVRNAQERLSKTNLLIRTGANTDSLKDDKYRLDKCHFSKLGLTRHAQLWYEAMTKEHEPM
jgi:hypothetical protein